MFDHPFQTPLGEERSSFWNCPCSVSRPSPLVGGRSSIPCGKRCRVGKDVVQKHRPIVMKHLSSVTAHQLLTFLQL